MDLLSEILGKTFAAIFSHYKELSRALVIPVFTLMLLDMALDILRQDNPTMGLVLDLVLGPVAYCVIGIQTHRYIILGRIDHLQWRLREWKFLGILVAMTIISLLVLLIGIPLVLEAPLVGIPVFLILTLLGIYSISRPCLILPAIAAEHPMRIREAIRLAYPYRFVAFAVFMVFPVLIGLVSYAFSWFYVPFLSTGIDSLVSSVATVIGVVALSVLYISATGDHDVT